MKLIKHTGVLIILVIFLAGSTGITFSLHTCLSAGKTDVTVFPGLFEKNEGCCCGSDAPASLASPDPLPASWDAPDCCVLSKVFFKTITFPAPETIKMSPAVVDLFQIGQAFAETSCPTSRETVNTLPLPDPSPPPLSGKLLVHFLHQVKIPFPAC
jgi:hypothetical protein